MKLCKVKVNFSQGEGTLNSILYFLYGISRWQLEDKDKFVFLQDVIMSLTEDIE